MGLNIPPSDQNIQLSDITTANALTTRHGFVKKLSNVATEFFNGQGNYTTPAGGMAASGSAYEIIGGSAVATTNGTQLLAAYVTAQAATPQGAALATGNRYTIFLLPGVYDLGAGTLTLATQYIDIIGLSTDTGWVTGAELTREGDTVILSTGPVINLTGANIQDIAIANVCIKLVTAGGNVALGTSHSEYGAALKVTNVLIRVTGGGTNPMQNDKNVGGTWIDVRSSNTGFMFGASFGTVITVSGYFLRCKCVSGFGQPFLGNTTLSGTFIDCEADNSAFGGGTSPSANVATLSGTFIRCRFAPLGGGTGPTFGGDNGTLSGTFVECAAVNAAWGAVMSGTMIGCYGTSPAGWNITGTLTGQVVNCDFFGWKGAMAVNTADSTTISNTVTETNFSLNKVISPIQWKVGRAFRWEAWGKFSTDGSTPGTLTIRAKFGTTVLRTSGALTLLGGATNAGWKASGVFVGRVLGGAATISTQLKVELDDSGFLGDSITPSNGTVSFATNVNNTFQLSAEFSVADTDNAITLENFIVIPEAGT